ncbi:hypothetical protein EDC01DRAFT_653110 [Geopyxis carbonaria]|nr:hypothetical protein EDC01DRAFT_653110 [Geopyxis carbonaria]
MSNRHLYDPCKFCDHSPTIQNSAKLDPQIHPHKRAKYGGPGQPRPTTLAIAPKRYAKLPYEMHQQILKHLIATTMDLQDVHNLLLACIGSERSSGLIMMVSVFRECGRKMVDERIANEKRWWLDGEEGLFSVEGVMGVWTQWVEEVFTEGPVNVRWKKNDPLEKANKRWKNKTNCPLDRFIAVVKRVEVGKVEEDDDDEEEE